MNFPSRVDQVEKLCEDFDEWKNGIGNCQTSACFLLNGVLSFGGLSELLQEKLLPGRVHDVVNPRLWHVTHSWFDRCGYKMLLHRIYRIILRLCYRIIYIYCLYCHYIRPL